MLAEKNIQAASLLLAGQDSTVRLFRNTVGEGWMGKTVRHEGNRVLIENARRVTFGLAVGSADAIGLQSVTIGPEHIGQTLAVFLSAEFKTARGSVREAQDRWAILMQSMGARHGLIREPADMARLIRNK